MKFDQTIQMEENHEIYLLDKTIKMKKIISKKVSITKGEITNINNSIESQFKSEKGEDKKFIEIIHSFEDPNNKVAIKNFSFISDIKTSDTQFPEKIKEELPKNSHDSNKEDDFLCNTIMSTKSINSNDINLIYLKDKYYIEEPLINNYNKTIQKSIKVINDDFFENFENIKKAENENGNNINNKDINKDGNNSNKNNINYEDNNRPQKTEKEDEEEDIERKKKNVIIKSLIYFNRDEIIDGIENFKKRIPDYNNSKYEEDNKFERNIYTRIEDRIREYLNKYKCDKLSKLREFENSYLLKIINFQNKSEMYKNMSIKGIIVGILNIINDFVGKEYLKISEYNVKNINYEKGEYFLDLYEKYEIMKKLSCYLEKDFILLINIFKKDIKFKISFDGLFSDIYWDYVFRIKELNIYFTKNYDNEKISKKAYDTMNNIIDILLNINYPYKQMIGQLLNISCIKKENVYLMNYIIKYKSQLFKRNIDNNIITCNNKDDNKNEKDKIIHGSSSCDKVLTNKINAIEIDNNNEKANNEEIQNYNNNENNNNINILNEDLIPNDLNNINNSISNDNDDQKNDLNLGKSFSMDISNNKLSDKDSIEAVYNFIINGESENDKKKQRKKHKKKKKNKNNNSIIIETDEKEEEIDPIVEEYKNYINNINNNCEEYVKKIKPNIKEEWINKISTSIKD